MKPFAGDKKPPEWFKTTGDESYGMYCKFRRDKGILKALGTIPYVLRNEQKNAVAKTMEYFGNHENGEFLWNAKPRFGKTLATYDLCKHMKKRDEKRAFNVLIVTNRPAIANSWYDDYVKFLGDESGFAFVSETDSLKSKPYVLTREQYVESVTSGKMQSAIEFVSLQDLKGSVYFGGRHEKLKEIKQMEWDLLVVDEAHEGVDTTKTDVAFYQIKRKHTLHLSGTPFKALANDKFAEDAIFNWTYAEEQAAKRDWDYSEGNNPYEPLPRLNLFTYQMSEIIRDELKQGIEIDGETEEYAFDLNLFFETKADGSFKYDESVDKFLDALTRLEKYPFSTEELRQELKHTIWLLNRVDSAKALAKKLKEHEVFGEYEIVLAAGDGRLSEDDEAKKSYDKVREAIENYEKTITISVGQLTTGITIPEWTAVLMLSNIKSPALYMQSAFRAQNPWKYQQGSSCYVKENAYVFDFDPARTLIIFEEFANDLSANTSGGRGDSDSRKKNVRELLNFFPVVGEDESGEMVELDAEKVLSIPRKIRSLEVVRRGFMSNFLFQNIANIFNAPQEVIDIIQNFEPISEKDAKPITTEERESVSVNEDGEIELDNEYVIGQAQDVFGEKIYEKITDVIEIKTAEIIETTPETQVIKKLQETFKSELIDPIMEITSTTYGADLKSREEKAIQKQLEQKTEKIVNQEVSDYTIKKAEIESQRKEALSDLLNNGKTEDEVNKEFDTLIAETTNHFKERILEKLEETLPTLTEEVVRTVETKKKEHQKETIEETVRNHLRGFSRTIPSFLMAYGDENTTLANFDSIIPDEVFKEVTSISLDKFRFLRDGGSYTDTETGEEKFYQGKLFDPVVFDDSVKEFLAMKKRLANYFDESNAEDIFDYIPPQKTNQIFTPKAVVKQMVDMLEE
ncbi:MAG: DEAD/DEAH box helicase family protein, partial [Clostridia bacterium]|nr:DEAD/DEAH box helicase family protein [Clostridia bacterium]